MCNDYCVDCKPCEKHQPQSADDQIDGIDKLICLQGVDPYHPHEWDGDCEQVKGRRSPMQRLQMFHASQKELSPLAPKNLEQMYCTTESCIWMTKKYEDFWRRNPSIHRHILPSGVKRLGKSSIELSRN